MRFLVVAHVLPWPARSGSSIRLATTVDALNELGTVDLCGLLEPAGAAAAAVPSNAPISRWLVLSRPPVDSGAVRRARGLLSTVPDRYARRDYSQISTQLADFASGPYDLAWLAQAESFIVFADVIDAPVVTDLYDLEDRKLEAEMEVRSPAAGLGGRARHYARAARDRIELIRWRTLHRRLATRSAALVVCSDADRDRLGLPNVEVVTNCYPPPAVPCGRPTVGTPPTVSFVGLLTYAPNVDAATFAAEEVLPRLRQRVPDARLRLVGRAHARVERLGDLPGVEVTGGVPDIAEELGRADAALVPIRFGSGTRIKILEAFAHRIPVASTTIGAEGLAAHHGEELLIADSADALAEACAELLTSVPLRSRLTEAAHELWQRTGVPARAAEQVRAVVRRALDT